LRCAGGTTAIAALTALTTRRARRARRHNVIDRRDKWRWLRRREAARSARPANRRPLAQRGDALHVVRFDLVLQKLRRTQGHLRDARSAHDPFEKRIVDENRLATDRQLNDAIRRVEDVAGFPDVDDAVFEAGREREALRILQGGEEEGSERQHSDAARPGTATDAAEGRFNLQPAALCHFAGDKSKRAATDIEQSGRLGAVAAELFYDRTRAVRQVKCSAVIETNTELAAGRGLEDVTAADRIARLDLKRITARPCKSARAHDDFDLPNDQCRPCRRLCIKAGRLNVGCKMTMAGH